MKNMTIIRLAGITAVAASSLLAGRAFADDVSVGIRIGEPAPPPVVVVQPAYTYDAYVVGPRRALYDTDWQLRLAQTDEIEAQRNLDQWRSREGEIAVVLDNREAQAAELRRAAAGGGAAPGELRVRLDALQQRINSARADLDAAKTLNDGPGTADAERRLRDNEAQAAATQDEIRRAQDGAGARERLAAAEGDLGRIHADLDQAHDAVYAWQQKLAEAHDRVIIALHDRDEALWSIHGDDILARRVEPDACGFHIDLAFFGGQWPRDREVLHRYFVREPGYWRERPLEIVTRETQVTRVTEVTRIRDIQRTREVTRIKEVETVETTVTTDQRRVYAERVGVERQRFVAERTERTTAAAENRKPRVDPVERAEAKAIVLKANADAKATVIGAKSDARAQGAAAKGAREQSQADAKSTVIGAKADARAEGAAARGGREQSQAAAKSTVIGAKADARAEGAAAKGAREQAQADARSTEIKAKADAASEQQQSKAAREQQAKAGRDQQKLAEEQARQSKAAQDAKIRADREAAKARPGQPTGQQPTAADAKPAKGGKNAKGKGKAPPSDPANPQPPQ